eukprot:6478075-Amphidinium_carterae.2
MNGFGFQPRQDNKQYNWNDGKNEHQVTNANTAYITIHTVHIEDYLDESSSSVETINIANVQDDYTIEDVNRLRQRFPTIPAENEEDYDEYNEMTLNNRKNRNDITRFQSDTEPRVGTLHTAWFRGACATKL